MKNHSMLLMLFLIAMTLCSYAAPATTPAFHGPYPPPDDACIIYGFPPPCNRAPAMEQNMEQNHFSQTEKMVADGPPANCTYDPITGTFICWPSTGGRTFEVVRFESIPALSLYDLPAPTCGPDGTGLPSCPSSPCDTKSGWDWLSCVLSGQ